MNHYNSLKKISFGFLIFFLSFWGNYGFAQERLLVPIGQTVGVTLDMEGVTIMDTTDVEDYDGKRHTPAKDAGLCAGDMIKTINGVSIESARELEEIVNSQGSNELEIIAQSKGSEKHCRAKAILSQKDGHYRLGIWIKDAASGLGTITYANPDTGEFGALGHSISEGVNEEVLTVQGGEVWKASIVSVQKGSKGQPGELIGVFSEGKEKIGEIQCNTAVGLKGKLDKIENLDTISDAIPVAEREDVCEGEAEILANIEENKIEKFSVEIQKINKNESDSKGMVVKITDQRLLNKTGGIVQGMSGSPIIQDGKLVGAITHVFVNDPTRGYGIFIENMLAEAEKIK